MDIESYSIMESIFIVLLIMSPAYLSNTIAVLTGGKYPIDQGKLFIDGNRILGDGKTWSGLVGGTFGGMVIGYLLIVSVYDFIWESLNFSILFLLSFGALFGDMSASFYKRRQNLQRGEKFALLDMYDFVFMSLLLCFIFERDWLLSWIFDGWIPLFTILILTPFLHRGVNIIGFKIGVKKEPW